MVYVVVVFWWYVDCFVKLCDEVMVVVVELLYDCVDCCVMI